jgi:hypothetical protein
MILHANPVDAYNRPLKALGQLTAMLPCYLAQPVDIQVRQERCADPTVLVALELLEAEHIPRDPASRNVEEIQVTIAGVE